MINRLYFCNGNEKVKIIKFEGGSGVQANVKTLGLKKDSEISIVKNELEKGPVFIANGEEIQEIGKELSKKIIVETESSSEFKLTEAIIGDILEISKMNAKGEVRRRLMDMGIVKGTQMEVLRVAPLGDPVELRIGNFNLSLRLSEAETISVKLVQIGTLNIA